MRGMMMDMPLTLTAILRHAATVHGEVEVVSREPDGIVHRTTYSEIALRASRLAYAITAFGLRPGDRVGTLAWNSARHLELYFGTSCAGFVCHTINPRLFPEQIAFIIRHAADSLLFVDPHLVGLVEGLGTALEGVKAIVVMADRSHMPSSSIEGLLCYDDLLDAHPSDFGWPLLDEHTAAGLCYTSGTTGEPKGVLYSHRSSVLHAMSVCMPDVFGVSGGDVVMPVVPMFHVAAWGLPYAAPLVGAKLVMPGPRLDGASLHDLITCENVTCTAGVPTVWMALLDWAEANGSELAPLNRVGIGGSACSARLIARFDSLGIEVIHAWGMTETSPVAVANRLQPKHRELAPAAMALQAAKQGRPLFGVETRVVDEDGHDVPRDGESYGTLLVRGPWIASGYYGLEGEENFATPGWFATGDVVTVDPDGTIQIVDRSKDVIKSGGEWISSIALESIAVGHPAIREAAAIAVPHERWGERPLLAVVLRDGALATPEEIIAYFGGKVARWAVPERIEFVPELPHTATGKLSKRHIRAMFC